MRVFEGICAAVVALSVATGVARAADRRRFLRRLALTGAAAWLAEETCIRAYDFYHYDEAWSVFVGRVPLMVALIWPVVVLSAGELSRGLGRGAIIAGALVFTDAALIEPIAVQAGLWSWHVPGLFAVPPIGVLGWALFAGAALAVFEAVDRRGGPAFTDAAVLVAAPLAAHALLLVTWWLALRWVSAPIPAWAGIAAAWAISLTLTVRALSSRTRDRFDWVTLAVRIPAALVFFVLLARHAREAPALVAYALAFVPPYLAVMPLPGARASVRDA